MKNRIKLVLFLMLVICLSCGKEKSIQLPEITNSTIREVHDVSPAYIFYDESKKDSVDLNRKNLIISTNWLVNVDKRLKLSQAIPAIQSLQEKKRKASIHKNETARNLYSCNDISIKNLGFIDFTDVVYHHGIDKNIVESQNIYKYSNMPETNYILSILFKEEDSITINSAKTTKDEFVSRLKHIDSVQNKIMGVIYLKFNENLTFQEYIHYKSVLSKLKLKHSTTSNDEYIFY